jgi:histidyl-tRNA synthetase
MSGFPEYLPAGRMVEQRVVDTLREVFELHGFASVQTRAVETLQMLNRKGEITKEVYTVRRIHAKENDTDTLGLHFDLTVPFARYVLENAGRLQFPFRRYQIQPAWRGERPQEGRYREFWQADIDIVGQGTLAFHHDAEVVLVMLEALQRLHNELGIPEVLLHANNRKLVQGFYEGLGVTDPLAAIQIVDKLNKVGSQTVRELLAAQAVMPDAIERILKLASIRTSNDAFIEQVYALGVSNTLVETGVAELAAFIKDLSARFPNQVMADLKIARGLDYYTGSVFEIDIPALPTLGTVCAGGRYDALATDGKNSYPGVGISFGITRVLAPLLTRGAVTANRPVPSAVLVAVDAEETRNVAATVATALRAHGVACEVSPTALAYGKQIMTADRRGIPYVWFGGLLGSVKDIRTGEQMDADANCWMPPTADLKPAIVYDAIR